MPPAGNPKYFIKGQRGLPLWLFWAVFAALLPTLAFHLGLWKGIELSEYSCTVKHNKWDDNSLPKAVLTEIEYCVLKGQGSQVLLSIAANSADLKVSPHQLITQLILFYEFKFQISYRGHYFSCFDLSLPSSSASYFAAHLQCSSSFIYCF